MAEGFSAMGLCAPDAIPEAAGRLAAFVAQGHHGQMGWMEERMAWRGNPAALWPQAKTVIMLAEVYSADRKPTPPDRGEISIYAQGKDYHDLVKRRLKRLGGWLVRQEPCEIKVFVDTAPVMEKPLAQAAGLGWQGKHTNLLSRDLGNWFFLGAICPRTRQRSPIAAAAPPAWTPARPRPFPRLTSWTPAAASPT